MINYAAALGKMAAEKAADTTKGFVSGIKGAAMAEMPALAAASKFASSIKQYADKKESTSKSQSENKKESEVVKEQRANNVISLEMVRQLRSMNAAIAAQTRFAANADRRTNAAAQFAEEAEKEKVLRDKELINAIKKINAGNGITKKGEGGSGSSFIDGLKDILKDAFEKILLGVLGKKVLDKIQLPGGEGTAGGRTRQRPSRSRFPVPGVPGIPGNEGRSGTKIPSLQKSPEGISRPDVLGRAMGGLGMPNGIPRGSGGGGILRGLGTISRIFGPLPLAIGVILELPGLIQDIKNWWNGPKWGGWDKKQDKPPSAGGASSGGASSGGASSRGTSSGGTSSGGASRNVAKEFIREEEGYKGVAYPDAGKFAIGYGTQLTQSDMKRGYINIGSKRVDISGGKMNAAEIQLGSIERFTKEHAETLLNMSLDKFEAIIIRAVGRENWDKLNENQKAAVLSYTYNVGSPPSAWVESVKSSKSIEYQAKAIEKGVNTSQGTVLEGLVKRRIKEAELYKSSAPPTSRGGSGENRFGNAQRRGSGGPHWIYVEGGEGGASQQELAPAPRSAPVPRIPREFPQGFDTLEPVSQSDKRLLNYTSANPYLGYMNPAEKLVTGMDERVFGKPELFRYGIPTAISRPDPTQLIDDRLRKAQENLRDINNMLHPPRQLAPPAPQRQKSELDLTPVLVASTSSSGLGITPGKASDIINEFIKNGFNFNSGGSVEGLRPDLPPILYYTQSQPQSNSVSSIESAAVTPAPVAQPPSGTDLSSFKDKQASENVRKFYKDIEQIKDNTANSAKVAKQQLVDTQIDSSRRRGNLVPVVRGREAQVVVDPVQKYYTDSMNSLAKQFESTTNQLINTSITKALYRDGKITGGFSREQAGKPGFLGNEFLKNYNLQKKLTPTMNKIFGKQYGGQYASMFSQAGGLLADKAINFLGSSLPFQNDAYSYQQIIGNLSTKGKQGKAQRKLGREQLIYSLTGIPTGSSSGLTFAQRMFPGLFGDLKPGATPQQQISALTKTLIGQLGLKAGANIMGPENLLGRMMGVIPGRNVQSQGGGGGLLDMLFGKKRDIRDAEAQDDGFYGRPMTIVNGFRVSKDAANEIRAQAAFYGDDVKEQTDTQGSFFGNLGQVFDGVGSGLANVFGTVGTGLGQVFSGVGSGLFDGLGGILQWGFGALISAFTGMGGGSGGGFFGGGGGFFSDIGKAWSGEMSWSDAIINTGLKTIGNVGTMYLANKITKDIKNPYLRIGATLLANYGLKSGGQYLASSLGFGETGSKLFGADTKLTTALKTGDFSNLNPFSRPGSNVSGDEIRFARADVGPIAIDAPIVEASPAIYPINGLDADAPIVNLQHPIAVGGMDALSSAVTSPIPVGEVVTGAASAAEGAYAAAADSLGGASEVVTGAASAAEGAYAAAADSLGGASEVVTGAASAAEGAGAAAADSLGGAAAEGASNILGNIGFGDVLPYASAILKAFQGDFKGAALAAGATYLGNMAGAALSQALGVAIPGIGFVLGFAISKIFGGKKADPRCSWGIYVNGNSDPTAGGVIDTGRKTPQEMINATQKIGIILFASVKKAQVALGNKPLAYDYFTIQLFGGGNKVFVYVGNGGIRKHGDKQIFEGPLDKLTDASVLNGMVSSLLEAMLEKEAEKDKTTAKTATTQIKKTEIETGVVEGAGEMYKDASGKIFATRFERDLNLQYREIYGPGSSGGTGEDAGYGGPGPLEGYEVWNEQLGKVVAESNPLIKGYNKEGQAVDLKGDVIDFNRFSGADAFKDAFAAIPYRPPSDASGEWGYDSGQLRQVFNVKTGKYQIETDDNIVGYDREGNAVKVGQVAKPRQSKPITTILNNNQAMNYLKDNPDVSREYTSGRTGYQSAAEYVQYHYNTYGQKENRKLRSDPFTYDNNQDLIQIGSSAVTNAYRKALGRAPDQGTINQWLNTGAFTEQNVVDAIVQTAEYGKRAAVVNAYSAKGLAPPDEATIQAWVTGPTGNFTQANVMAAIDTVQAQNYFARNPDVAAEFASGRTGMSESDYAQYHYNMYGKNEQRVWAATGGIFSGPKEGYAAMLHGAEAVVPLPDGKTIPVELTIANNRLSDIITPVKNQTIGTFLMLMKNVHENLISTTDSLENINKNINNGDAKGSTIVSNSGNDNSSQTTIVNQVVDNDFVRYGAFRTSEMGRLSFG